MAVEFLHSPAEIMQVLLTTGSGSLFTDPPSKLDWPLYVNYTPDDLGDEQGDTKPNIATIQDTPGVITHRFLDGRVLQNFGIVMRARSVGDTDGRTKLQQTLKFLNTADRPEINVSGKIYRLDTTIQLSPATITGRDEKRRALAAVSFQVMFIGA